jgi:uncharacterized membrane protein YbaN (DUF454 family)
VADPKRPLFIALGCLCVGLGAVGAVVPGMPTTIFLLGASWLFARSSPKLRERLLASRLAGPLRRYEETGRMTARSKAAAIGAMWAGITLAVWMARQAAPLLPASIVLLGLLGTAVILFLVPGERSAPAQSR